MQARRSHDQEAEQDDIAELQKTLTIAASLRQGREPAMYTDIDYVGSKVQLPADRVRDIVAQNILSLAHICRVMAVNHVATKPPKAWSRAEDRFFTMKSGRLRTITTSGDFWLYYLAQAQSGKKDIAVAVTDYEDSFLLKKRTFSGPDTAQPKAEPKTEV